MTDETVTEPTPQHNEESTDDNQVAVEAPAAEAAPQEGTSEVSASETAAPASEEEKNEHGETPAVEAVEPATGDLPEGAEANPEAAADEEANVDGDTGESAGEGEKVEAPAAEDAEELGGNEGDATATEGEAATEPADGEAVTDQPEGEAASAPVEVEPSAEATEGEIEGKAAAQESGDAEGTPVEGADEAPAAEGEEAAVAGEGEEVGGVEPVAEGQPPLEEVAEGDRPESPPRASEKLSREPTPTAEERMLTDRIDEVDEEAERPEPTSPDAVVATFDELDIIDDEGDEDEEEEEEEEYEEEEVEEEEFNREFMITSYKQAMQEREQKLHQNSLLQTKLSDYFRRKKADQGGQPEAGQETEKSITDQEQRYAKFVYNLDELRHSRDAKRQEFDDRIKDLELECQGREEQVRLLFQGLLDAKRKVGLKAVSATNGRPFPAVTQKRSEASGGKAQDPLSTSVDDMMQDESALEDQVVRVRLENIGLGNRVHKCETSLKAKEELSEGLHMIDFEQLKIENQTYNEKIEERQEELLKLKKKITNNVQVLTHLKEKLQFVQCKNQEQGESLKELDKTLSKRRDQLTRTKQSRDSLRNDNQRLKQNSGLLGNEALLRNFEENVDLVTDKRSRLDELKMEHSEMSLQCSKLKRKIDVARAQSAQ